MRTRSLCIKLAILFAFACVSILAQGTGSITGVVRDNTGAVVPGAQVTITNTDQGTEFKTTTNSDGEYLEAALPPGNYSLTVSAPGFTPLEEKGIILRVAEKQRADANLSVG